MRFPLLVLAEIHQDGKATFTGEEHVKAKVVRELRVRQEDSALLNTVVQRMGFWSLKDRYQDKEDGCATLFSDASSVSIHVFSAGKAKSVFHYRGCRGPAIPAEALDRLAATID